MIRVCLFGIVMPLVAIELLFLLGIYGMSRRDIDAKMTRELNKISESMDVLMTSMNVMSWLLMADGTVGQGLYSYFEEEDSVTKGNLLIYLQEQIGHYEVANPSIGNITYIFVPSGEGAPRKINQTSLAYGSLPLDEHILCHKQQVTYYGPHMSDSKVAKYPCLSLTRIYKEGIAHGDVYIYLESGFRYLETIIPSRVEEVNAIFRIEAQGGETQYSTDEEVFPLYKIPEASATGLWNLKKKYKMYELPKEGGWKLQLWVPMGEYYSHIRTLTLNFSLITLMVVGICIIISVQQWRGVYRPFVQFEEYLQLIAESDDVEAGIFRMDIREFDDQFALIEKMKNDIALLLTRIQQEEKRYNELEFKAVSGKMTPHFLHNTLDTLKWFAAEKQEREMVCFITSLNKLLLYNMSKIPETTLGSELEAVNNYIVLQEMKYDLDFHIEAGKYPQLLAADMPRFCLQPLVENAILHSGSDKVQVWIEVELLINGKIAILVKNTGKPLEPERIEAAKRLGKDVSIAGIGLPFVVRMLENRFGDNFEIKAMHMAGGINVVEIRIPFEMGKALESRGDAEDGERRHDKGVHSGG